MKNNDRNPTTEYPLVLFTSQDGALIVPSRLDRETVWLSQAQMAVRFGTERTVITKRIRNAINEGEVDEQQECAVVAHSSFGQTAPSHR